MSWGSSAWSVRAWSAGQPALKIAATTGNPWRTAKKRQEQQNEEDAIIQMVKAIAHKMFQSM